MGTKPRLNQNSPNIFGQWMGQTEKPKKNIENDFVVVLLTFCLYLAFIVLSFYSNIDQD